MVSQLFVVTVREDDPEQAERVLQDRLGADDRVDVVPVHKAYRLDDGQQHHLVHAIQNQQVGRLEQQLVDEVRETAPYATQVVFDSSEWDDGFFLDEQGTVVDSAGSRRTVNFGYPVKELLTDIGGCVGRRAQLIVQPGTGWVELEECGVVV